MSNPLTKKCTRCGEEKDLNLFSPSKTGKMGRYPRCRSCQNTASRKYTDEDIERLDQEAINFNPSVIQGVTQ